MTPLAQLMQQAMDAAPGERIQFRDPIAAHGERAIDAMADWLGDSRLAAFAIRVLERIGREPATRAAAVAVLASVDCDSLLPHLADDVERALAALGGAPRRPERPKSAGRPARPAGQSGVRGRRYWVMRTSPWERPFLWAEARAGRLRQGWGVEDEQDLRVIEARLRDGQSLTGSQREARGALRMLASWHDSVQVGDIVVAPNLPEHGRLSVFRVTGSYRWEPSTTHTWGERFGHVLPVEPLLENLDRRDATVSDALRSALRAQTRLYNIDGCGGDVERLLGTDEALLRHRESWTEAGYEVLFTRFPPEGPRPTAAQIAELAAELGRTPDAVASQWEDGASYIRGGSATTTGHALMAWLDAESVEVVDPVILVRINRLYRDDMTPDELYEATRKSWVVGPRREGARYALALFAGKVRQVYEIEAWRPAVEPGRWEFVGRVADEGIRDRYVGRSVRGYLKHGHQSPIVYVNC